MLLKWASFTQRGSSLAWSPASPPSSCTKLPENCTEENIAHLCVWPLATSLGSGDFVAGAVGENGGLWLCFSPHESLPRDDVGSQDLRRDIGMQ